MKLKMLGALVGLVCLSASVTNEAQAQGCYGRGGGGYFSAQVVLPPVPVPVPVAPAYGYGYNGCAPRARAWRPRYYNNNCGPTYRNYGGGYGRNRGYNRGHNRGYSYNNGYNNGGRRNGYNNGYGGRGNGSYHYSR